MLKSSFRELKNHYGFYLAVFAIAIILNLLIWWLGSMLGLNRSFQNAMMMVASYGQRVQDLSPEEMLYFLSGSLREMNVPYIVLTQIIFTLLTTLVTIMMNRTMLQKVNYPETRIADAAYFNTRPGDCLILPVKLFFARFVVGIIYAVLLLAVGILMGMAAERLQAMVWVIIVIVILLLLALGVFVLPIQYLVAYDVERRYNFWSTITKSLAIGRDHFLRILKTLIVQFFLNLLYIAAFIFIFYMIAGTGNDPLSFFWILILLAVAGYVLWMLPLMNIYLIETMNRVISQEY